MGVKIRKMSRRRTRKPRRNKKSPRNKNRNLSKKKLGDPLSRDTIELKNKKGNNMKKIFLPLF